MWPLHQSWPHPSLLIGEQRTSPRGQPPFLFLFSPSSLPGKTPNKWPLCLEHLPRTETQLFAWHCQTTQWTGSTHKSTVIDRVKRETRGGKRARRKDYDLYLAYIHKPTHIVLAMGLGSTVWRGWMLFSKYLPEQKGFFSLINSRPFWLGFMHQGPTVSAIVLHLQLYTPSLSFGHHAISYELFSIEDYNYSVEDVLLIQVQK